MFILLSLLVSTCFALDCATLKSCESCAGQHQGFLTCNWCLASSSCVISGNDVCDRKNAIEVAFDCPRDPQQGFEYNETFARARLFPLAAAAYEGNIQSTCLKNANISANITKKAHLACDKWNGTCFGYAGVVENEKAIFIVARGSTKNQVIHEIQETFDADRDFPGGGKVHEYFYDAFDILWNAGGLGDEILRLKLIYPDFELWVTGHSLGAAIASLFGEMAVYKELWPGDKVKLITFGQPRTGDIDYAAGHDAKVFLYLESNDAQQLPYSYRVIHAHDIVPHIPPKMGSDPLFHHRFEVWYNNSMRVGQPYQICNRPDDDSCSNQDEDMSEPDHDVYFSYSMKECCDTGCPPR